MKLQFGILTALVLVFGFIAGCSDYNETPEQPLPQSPKTKSEQLSQESEQAVEESKDATQAAIETAAERKDEFVANMNETLEDANAHIANYEERLQNVGDNVRTRLNDALSDLKFKRDDFQQELAKLNETGAEAWEDLKAGVEQASSELKAAFENIKEDFEEEPNPQT